MREWWWSWDYILQKKPQLEKQKRQWGGISENVFFLFSLLFHITIHKALSRSGVVPFSLTREDLSLIVSLTHFRFPIIRTNSLLTHLRSQDNLIGHKKKHKIVLGLSFLSWDSPNLDNNNKTPDYLVYTRPNLMTNSPTTCVHCWFSVQRIPRVARHHADKADELYVGSPRKERPSFKRH